MEFGALISAFNELTNEFIEDQIDRAAHILAKGDGGIAGHQGRGEGQQPEPVARGGPGPRRQDD